MARDCGAYMGSVALFTETIFVAESRGRISQTWLAGTWLISAVIFIVIAIIYYFLCRWKYSSRMTCDSGFNINYIVRVKEGQKKKTSTYAHTETCFSTAKRFTRTSGGATVRWTTERRGSVAPLSGPFSSTCYRCENSDAIKEGLKQGRFQSYFRKLSHVLVTC